MPSLESSRLARTMQKRLLSEARETAREDRDIRPGTTHFWDLMTTHMALVSDIYTAVANEIAEEKAAMGTETRQCETKGCKEKVFKKHVRGRWPMYCDTCRAA